MFAKRYSSTHIMFGVVVAILVSVSAVAGHHQESEGVKKKSGRAMQFERWDADGNALLDVAEMLAMVTAQRDSGKGRWKAEWTPEAQARRRLKKRDVDGDGALSKEEFMAKVTW